MDPVIAPVVSLIALAVVAGINTQRANSAIKEANEKADKSEKKSDEYQKKLSELDKTINNIDRYISERANNSLESYKSEITKLRERIQEVQSERDIVVENRLSEQNYEFDLICKDVKFQYFTSTANGERLRIIAAALMPFVEDAKKKYQNPILKIVFNLEYLNGRGYSSNTTHTVNARLESLVDSLKDVTDYTLDQSGRGLGRVLSNKFNLYAYVPKDSKDNPQVIVKNNYEVVEVQVPQEIVVIDKKEIVNKVEPIVAADLEVEREMRQIARKRLMSRI